MSEVHDFARRRLADFLAARIQAQHIEKTEAQQTRQESSMNNSPRSEQNKKNTTE